MVSVFGHISFPTSQLGSYEHAHGVVVAQLQSQEESKIIKSGVNHISISDHALVFMTYKTHFERTGSRLIKTRYLKNFNKENFLRDLGPVHLGRSYPG